MKREDHYRFYVAEGSLREKAVGLHHRRYEEVGFYREGEEDPYESLSKYFSAMHEHNHEVVGVTRLIYAKLDEFPTMKYFEISSEERKKLRKIEGHRLAEISAFTKMPAHDVGMGLIKTVLQYSLDNGLSHWICCIDDRVYNYMYRMFKFPFKRIGTPQVYLGSTSIPCVLNLKECLTILQQHRPTLYDYLMDRENSIMEVS